MATIVTRSWGLQTGAMMIALGQGIAGAFTPSDALANKLKTASSHAGAIARRGEDMDEILRIEHDVTEKVAGPWSLARCRQWCVEVTMRVWAHTLNVGCAASTRFVSLIHVCNLCRREAVAHAGGGQLLGYHEVANRRHEGAPPPWSSRSGCRLRTHVAALRSPLLTEQAWSFAAQQLLQTLRYRS